MVELKLRWQLSAAEYEKQTTSLDILNPNKTRSNITQTQTLYQKECERCVWQYIVYNAYLCVKALKCRWPCRLCAISMFMTVSGNSLESVEYLAACGCCCLARQFPQTNSISSYSVVLAWTYRLPHTLTHHVMLRNTPCLLRATGVKVHTFWPFRSNGVGEIIVLPSNGSEALSSVTSHCSVLWGYD